MPNGCWGLAPRPTRLYQVTVSSNGALEGKKLGFIGGGNMAEALLRGLLKAEAVSQEHIRVSDPSETRRVHLAQHHGVTVNDDNAATAAWADVVVLATKPQVIEVALASIAALRAGTLVISIAAGVTTAKIAKALPAGTRVIRAMPNTPALSGQGATAIAKGSAANDDDLAIARAVFEAVGRCVTVAEQALDAVTGLSGSGPAYVMLFIEALADGGVRAGLPRDVAMLLATQTVLGSAQLQLDTGEHPAVLKDRVTSPGGTTAAGLNALEDGAFRASVIAAVMAATERSRELGE